MGKPFLYDTPFSPCLVVISRDNTIHITFSQHRRKNKQQEGKKSFSQANSSSSEKQPQQRHLKFTLGELHKQRSEKYTPQFAYFLNKNERKTSYLKEQTYIFLNIANFKIILNYTQ